MAKIAANVTRQWIDEFPLATEISGWTQDVNQETPVTTTLGVDGPRRVTANYDHSIQFAGFFDGDGSAGLPDEEFWNILGDNATDHYMTVAMGQTIGDVAYTGGAALEAQPRSGAIAGAVLLNFTANGRTTLSRDAVLGLTTSTGAENLAGFEQGATTTPTTYRVVFRLISFTGTSVTMNVEESSDDGSGDAYVVISGLTSGALSSPGVVVATTTASTEAWKRIALSGTYSSAEIVVTAGALAGE